MISASVLTGSTAIWILFEWLNYHFLSLIFFSLIIGMVAQFLWSNPSGLMKRSPSQVPRIVLPDELFVSIAITIGAVVNRFLAFLQNVASGGNLKQFLADLWVHILCQCCTKDSMTKLRRSENAKCKSKSHTSETSSHVRRHEREVH